MVKGMLLCIFVGVFCSTVADWTKSYALEFTKKFANNNNGFGQYSFEFETPDGTYRKEDGGLFMNKEGHSLYAVRGEYHYKDPDGNIQSMKYIADEHGFQPLIEDEYRFNDRRIV